MVARELIDAETLAGHQERLKENQRARDNPKFNVQAGGCTDTACGSCPDQKNAETIGKTDVDDNTDLVAKALLGAAALVGAVAVGYAVWSRKK